MKKAIVVIIVFVLFCPFVNLPVYIFSNINFYDSDTLTQDLQDNSDYYYDGKCTDAYLEYYEDNIENLLNAVSKIDFTPVENTDAIILLSFRNPDKESRMAGMPMSHKTDSDIILGNIQFFVLDGKNYMLCYYHMNTFCYKLYTYDDNEQLNSALNNECFLTDGIFSSAKSIAVKSATFTLFYRYIPVIVLSLLLFLPFLFFSNKNISAKNKKRIIFATKMGLFVIPVCALFCSVYIYRYSASPELLSSFFYVIKGIITRFIG